MNKDKSRNLITAFYGFTYLEKEKVDSLVELLKLNAELYQIKGTILIAEEGVNGTICGNEKAINKLIILLESHLPKNCLDKKLSWSTKQAFKRLRVRKKKEIVTIGIPQVDPLKSKGTYIEPANWNEFIDDPDTIVIDTRNKYEIGIGTFRGSLNPNTENFRDFPKWVKENLKRLIKDKKAKRIAMFCTGGIRCEKATSYLLKEGFKNVHHLHGGILKYLEEVPEENSLWEGECFVFDQRVALNHELRPGIHCMCHACGLPLTPEDMKKKTYVPGIQCGKCINKYSSEDRERFAERQRQLEALREKQGREAKKC